MQLDRAKLGLRRCAASLLLAAVALAAGRASGQLLGLYFDADASRCDGPLESFGRQHLYLCGFPPPDSQVVGLRFTLQLPANVYVDAPSMYMHRDIVLDATGDWRHLDDVDLQFVDCLRPEGVMVILEFDVFDTDFTGPRPNLVIKLKGTTEDSVNARYRPQWKICNPEDPLGYRSLMDAPPVDSVFNCPSPGQCPCTTAVEGRTWAAVKSLYLGR